ncbi:uncharacterized protein FOBCDRAFT_319463 [Fusarium oxysporum Fo47]|uniref:uncharacterized protein n=1 Tax=Fusarium oxysporum Fo47 TaxID=660027 RepID=UPI0028699E0E|nr:uncharacterized protein FOBCDRAFT_319463 [Fusarium oxysporum Fo47]QKD54411.2 hypothetical protein FOBCDRAFT_319463 [Fusarium oxysporum Fo47]
MAPIHRIFSSANNNLSKKKTPRDIQKQVYCSALVCHVAHCSSQCYFASSSLDPSISELIRVSHHPVSTFPTVWPTETFAPPWDADNGAFRTGPLNPSLWVFGAWVLSLGFLELKKDWRWSFYVLLWLGDYFSKKARRIRKAKIPRYYRQTVLSLHRGTLDHSRFLLILSDVIYSENVALRHSLSKISYSGKNTRLVRHHPSGFQQRRGWNSGVGELPLIGTVIGAFIGGGIVLIDTRIRKKKIENGDKQMEPEDRLPLAMIGGVGFAVTMFWFAWTAEYNSIHWIVPTLAGTFLATSLMLIFVAFLTYLVDVYLMYAASAIAANTIARSACGAAAPLFTTQMFDTLGVGGGGSLIGGVATVLAIIPFLFYRYGKQIRIRSKFAPTEEKSEAREKDEELADNNAIARRNSVLSHSDSQSSSDTTVAAA